MKSFLWMYLLIGIAHGAGTVNGLGSEEKGWVPAAAGVVSAAFWPVIMSFNVEDNLRAMRVLNETT